VKPDEIVGVVGPSGSAKSTLIQLLLRLREPSSGRVVANGRDVKELDLDEWYRHVLSFVPQDVHLSSPNLSPRTSGSFARASTTPRSSMSPGSRTCTTRSWRGRSATQGFDEPAKLEATSSFYRETLLLSAMR
jgi:energy-coupling factor transporter ATP-binding protein EcfA2